MADVQSLATPALQRFARLLPLPSGTPAYLGLSHGIRLMIMDGHLALGARLPSERLLAAGLGLSRTTVTSAYRDLVNTGWASARQGSGTVARMPARDRAPSLPLVPDGSTDTIDLSAAAGLAPSGTANIVARALEWLPRTLGGAGYEPVGARHLRERIAAWYEGRGVPTDPDQVIVTPGALAAVNVVLHALVRPGGRVAVDAPTYPGALGAIDAARARPVPVPLGDAGWDLPGWAETLRRTSPTAAYLIPDFHNPTGHLMGDPTRRELAGLLAQADCIPIVDETLACLDLDGGPGVAAWAGLDDRAVAVGSLSKVLWGGFRVGWIRCPPALLPAVRQRQLALSLGPSAIDQLVATTYLEAPETVLAEVLDRLRETRDAWLDDLDWMLPEWRFQTPRGGLALWVELPHPLSTELSLVAAGHGLALTPGPRFSPDRTLASRLRLPLTLPPDAVSKAAGRLADAWQDTLDGVRGVDLEPRSLPL
ncbi:MAG: PLP-dependent aminotransferase family protein [Propionicimonas sp.]|nr:PLP-dependent aminotransferase family protein [Propionicimonas sp.]